MFVRDHVRSVPADRRHLCPLVCTEDENDDDAVLPYGHIHEHHKCTTTRLNDKSCIDRFSIGFYYFLGDDNCVFLSVLICIIRIKSEKKSCLDVFMIKDFFVDLKLYSY